jgi:hypothetical protein
MIIMDRYAPQQAPAQITRFDPAAATCENREVRRADLIASFGG